MLYTMQDELYGGARGRAPKGQTAKEKADDLKTKIKNNDADFLDKYMQYGYEKKRFDKTVKIGNNYANMLEIRRTSGPKACRILINESLEALPLRDTTLQHCTPLVLLWYSSGTPRICFVYRGFPRASGAAVPAMVIYTFA